MKKIYLTYIILFLYIIFQNYLVTSIFSVYAGIMNMIILSIIAVTFFFLFDTKYTKSKDNYDKTQNIIIILIIYSLIYFMSGLFFGYEKSIYNRSLITLLKVVFTTIGTITVNEYIRYKLITNSKDTLINNSIISFLLAFSSMNVLYIFSVSEFSYLFKMFSSLVLPLIITSYVMTYLQRNMKYKTTIIYLVWTRLLLIILPILPSHPWIVTTLFGLLLPMFVYFNISTLVNNSDSRTRRFIDEKNGGITILAIVVSVLIMFILRVFNYYPMAVLSDSMKDTFKRGDLLILEKLSDKDINNLVQYDIIYYRYDNTYVVHRINYISRLSNGDIDYLITKGDNNSSEDNWRVYPEDIVAKYNVSLPYFGYPTVWFNELLNN